MRSEEDTSELHSLSLHDALPICTRLRAFFLLRRSYGHSGRYPPIHNGDGKSRRAVPEFLWLGPVERTARDAARRPGHAGALSPMAEEQVQDAGCAQSAVV